MKADRRWWNDGRLEREQRASWPIVDERAAWWVATPEQQDAFDAEVLRWMSEQQRVLDQMIREEVGRAIRSAYELAA